MSKADNFGLLFRDMMARLSGQESSLNAGKKNNGNNAGEKDGQNNQSNKANQNGCGKISINPSQALVIAGILAGVLDVDSVLVDKEQTVQILLSGSLKQKTQLEKMMDQIGTMPFDDVIKALIERL